VANGHFTGKRVEIFFSEDLGYQSHVGVDVDGFAVGGSDARAFLATVLKSEETEKGEPTSLFPRHVYAYNATLFPGVVEGVTELEGGKLGTHAPILRPFQGLVNGM
jgi:hypothetical protein